MRPVVWLFVVGLAGSVAANPPTEKATPRLDSQQVTRLVGQLGSRRFQDRQKASQVLEEIGAQALAPLQQAARTGDYEIRRRAEALVQQIQRRLESEKFLAPKRVHFVCKNRSIPDAVAEFARITGMAVQIEPASQSRLAKQRLTLDTGDATFWEAYAQLCHKACLVEATQAAPTPQVNQYGNGMVMAYNPYQQRPVQPITLRIGKQPATPVCYRGAMRVRVLPPRTPLTGHTRGDGETLFGLDITPQPGMEWEGVVSMRVTRAIDENGLHLVQPGVYVGGAAEQSNQTGWVVFMNGSAPEQNITDPTQIPVHLRLRSQRSERLNELDGVVTVQVLTPPMPLITVPDVLKAGNKEFSSADRHRLKILDLKQEKNGQVRAQVEISGPQRGNGVGGMSMSGGIGVSTGLKLEDAKGQELSQLRVESMSTNYTPWKFTQTMTVVFSATKTHSPPARLVYTARRTAVLDVPFHLKNVPLP